MCLHTTNPHRLPQPHPLSEWPPSQETAKPPPTTHPKVPAPRPTHPQGRSGTEPEQALEANKPPPRAPRESPILPRASSARAGSVPRSHHPRPTLQTPSPKETHRLFEKRTSRATNPWTAIVSANPSSSSHEQSAQCPHQNQRHHDRLAATGDPNDPRPSGTTARPELPPMRSRTGCLVVRPDAPHRRHRSRLLRLNPHCPSSNRNRTFQPHPRKT